MRAREGDTGVTQSNRSSSGNGGEASGSGGMGRKGLERVSRGGTTEGADVVCERVGGGTGMLRESREVFQSRDSSRLGQSVGLVYFVGEFVVASARETHFRRAIVPPRLCLATRSFLLSLVPLFLRVNRSRARYPRTTTCVVVVVKRTNNSRKR